MTQLPATLPELTNHNAVRHAIARAMLGVPPNATLGTVTLMPHQVDAVARLSVILQRHHVALLADDVGLGKTFVALAVAQRYAHVHIVAPAALLPMWQSAVARARTAHASIASLQRYSQSPPPAADLPNGSLLVIDEAHHLRNGRTTRYRAISTFAAGHDVLLLSATPIHNAPADLRHLMALALGHHAARLTENTLGDLVVRRAQRDAEGDVRPQVQEHPPHVMPNDPQILNAILALPAPLPAHDGAVAGALIKLGLLRAWCSSDAALAQMLSKRWLRGEALRQALLAGRHPSAGELRSWVVGDADVQLAFPELLATHEIQSAPLIEVLTRHLDAVRALRTQHATRRSHDLVRARALRAILKEHGATPVVAFSQFAETVRAIGRALTDIAGVGVLTGQRATIASGPISRQAALEAFAPIAHGRAPPPEHERIRVLVTTDLLAEGVNLQDAGVVVHLDLPWTDALRHQRVGRCARVGSPHAHVHVYAFTPSVGAERVLRIQRRLRRKARWAQRIVGASTTSRAPAGHGRPARVSAPDAASQLREVLTSWMSANAESARTGVAIVTASAAAFIALVRDAHGQHRLVSGRRRVDVRLRPLLARLGSMQPHQSAPPSVVVGTELDEQWRLARRALRRWMRRQRNGVEIGAEEPAAAASRARVRAQLHRVWRALGPVDRARCRASWLAAEHMLRAARGAGADDAVHAWSARLASEGPHDWLMSWRRFPALNASVQQLAGESAQREPNGAAVLSVLLLRPSVEPSESMH